MNAPDDATADGRASRDGGPGSFDQLLLCCPTPELAGDDDLRVHRIAHELSVAFERLGSVSKAVSFFGSARATRDSTVYLAARELAAALGRRGYSVITGGGPGLMEAANRGALDVGAPSIGLTIELPVEQMTNPYVSLEVPFHHFFARKLMFVRYASAFLVLPGGFGTLDELFEALTLVQTATIASFPVVLIGTDYWAGLIEWIDRSLVDGGRVTHTDRALLTVLDDPDEAVDVVERAYAEQIVDRDRRSTEATAARAD